MPRVPLDSFAVYSVTTTEVEAIQVGKETLVVPPARLVHLRTVITVGVIVAVLRAE